MSGPSSEVKISELPAATVPLSGSEQVPLVQAGQTVKAPVSAFFPIQTNLVGKVGGGQSGATQLIVGYNVIVEITNYGDSFVMPLAKAGAVVVIIMAIVNGGGIAQIGGLWPNGLTDTINGYTAADDFIDLPSTAGLSDSSAIFTLVCGTDGAWFGNVVAD